MRAVGLLYLLVKVKISRRHSVLMLLLRGNLASAAGKYWKSRDLWSLLKVPYSTRGLYLLSLSPVERPHKMNC